LENSIKYFLLYCRPTVHNADFFIVLQTIRSISSILNESGSWMLDFTRVCRLPIKFTLITRPEVPRSHLMYASKAKPRYEFIMAYVRNIPHPRRGYGYGYGYGYNHVFVSSAFPMKRNNLYNKGLFIV